MKNKIVFLGALLISLQLLSQSILSQNLTWSDESEYDTTENISSQPTLNFLNFDDLIFNADNSIAISPNRYAGVSFYSPNTSTWLTHSHSYSNPNSLAVGYSVGGDVYSVDNLIIEFAQPSKDIAFLWGRDNYYSSGTVDIYENNNQLVASFPIGFNGYWYNVSLNQYSQRIKKIILRRPSPISDNRYGHIFIDNFQFTPATSQPPVGWLDTVDSDGTATGWSQDPDLPAQPNTIHFYINGPAGSVPLTGQTVANLYRSDVGNHGFRFSIPAQYHDGLDHPVYAYGIDLTGDSPSLLSGSPKIFNSRPTVQTTTFIQLPQSLLSVNPNDGGGERIYPDEREPGERNRGIYRDLVKVKAKLSAATAGVRVYFSSFDLDEPSTDDLPIDTNASNSGNDNRIGSSFRRGLFSCPDCEITPNNLFVVPTDANGEATIEFAVRQGHPGDNYAVAASTKESDLIDANIAVEGLNVRNTVSNKIFQIGTDRTKMLTVWRKLHIETDSMGLVQNNYKTMYYSGATEAEVGGGQVILQIRASFGRGGLEPGRFQNGRLLVNGYTLYIDDNDAYSVTVHSEDGLVIIPPLEYFTLYDDDDFNSDNAWNGFDADNGEEVEELYDSFNLLQENDDKYCGDGSCNVFAAAYITPERTWGNQYRTSDVPFVLNVTSTSIPIVRQQIDNGRFLNSGENDDFWVVYAQIAYQGSTDVDCDPITERCIGGITVRDEFFANVVRQASQVPVGSQGALLFIEVIRDAHRPRTNNARFKTVPHEIGHQFGIEGDESLVEDCGLMCYSNGLTFSDEHLNIIRWRRKSPGQP